MGLTIGRLAGHAGVTPDTLRYYERKGLLEPDHATPAGYRIYGPEAVARLRFIRQAKECGFTLSEIRDLLTLGKGHPAQCADLQKAAAEKKAWISGKIRSLEEMAKAIDGLRDQCADDLHSGASCRLLGLFEAGEKEKGPGK